MIAGLLDKKRKAVEHLAAHAARLYDRFAFIYGQGRPNLTGPFRRDIDETLGAAHKFGPDLPAFEIGALVCTCDTNFAEIAGLAGLFCIEDPGGGSQTYRLETAAEIDSFQSRHAVYRDSGLSAEIYAVLVKGMKLAAPDAEAEFKRESMSYELYAAYLRDAMGRCKAADCWQFTEMLERAKTAMLADGTAAPRPTATLWPLQKFGLMPYRRHMTLGDLATLLFKSAQARESANLTLSDVVALARAEKVNVLVQWYITPTHVEYDIARLLGGEVPRFAGVNDETIAIYSNIRRYSAAANAGPAGYRMEEYRHCPSPAWLVLRTQDGAHWDILCDRALDGDRPVVHESVVERLIRGPSPRVDAYNAIKARAVTAALLPLPTQLTELLQPSPQKPEGSAKIKYKPIVDTLVGAIMTRIIAYVDKSLVPLPTDPMEVEKALADPKFVDIMREELLRGFAALDEKMGAAKAPGGELVGTFLFDLENPTGVISQFSRNIKTNTIDLKLSSKLFKEHAGEALRTRLYNLFVDVIRRSVDTAIMTKRNIFEKIMAKSELLKVLEDAAAIKPRS